MSKSNLYGADYKRSERIGAWWLMAVCKVVGWLPYWFLYYVLSPFLYFVLYRLLGYRKRVVRENLQFAFPEKSIEELRTIERKFYHHLAEVFVDTVDLASMSPKRIKKRMQIVDLEGHIAATKDKSWVAALGHYGSWEFFCSYGLYRTGATTIGVYHKLKNRAFDLFYYRLRSRMLTEPVAMKGLIRRLIRANKSGEKFVLGLIADQSPPKNYEIDHWYDFLGRPTSFFGGLEYVCANFGTQVYYVDLEKVRPGHYTCRLVQIYDGVEEVDRHEITQRYADRLSQTIRRTPELWLWSHRRWKRQPETETAK